MPNLEGGVKKKFKKKKFERRSLLQWESLLFLNCKDLAHLLNYMMSGGEDATSHAVRRPILLEAT